MNPSIKVERDTEGLQMALRSLFEETFVRSQLDSQAATMSSDDAAVYLDAGIPPRELSPGYYRRASYLLDLAGSIEVGCTYDASVMTRADIEGLQALKSARSGFERDHPPCPRCGARQYSSVIARCHSCQCDFTRAA